MPGEEEQEKNWTLSAMIWALAVIGVGLNLLVIAYSATLENVGLLELVDPRVLVVTVIFLAVTYKFTGVVTRARSQNGTE